MVLSAPHVRWSCAMHGYGEGFRAVSGSGVPVYIRASRGASGRDETVVPRIFSSPPYAQVSPAYCLQTKATWGGIRGRGECASLSITARGSVFASEYILFLMVTEITHTGLSFQYF